MVDNTIRSGKPQQYMPINYPSPSDRIGGPQGNNINPTNYNPNISSYSSGDSIYRGGGGNSSISSMMGGMTKPTRSANMTEEESLDYQEQLQAYNRMITMLTNILQIEHDTKKAVIQNFRV